MKVRNILAVLTAIAFLFFGLIINCRADDDDIFWFVMISDTHIGSNDDCNERLSWIVNNAYQIINPNIVINAGDLTDQHPIKNALGGTQDEQQWQEYHTIVFDAGMDEIVSGIPVYADAPGNHDQYNENLSPMTNYVGYSVQGIAVGQTQQSRLYGRNSGNYHFITINTAHPNMIVPSIDGANRCPGELSQAELNFIEKSLNDCSDDVNLSFIFGHHALGRDGKSDWGRITEGRTDFIQILNDYNVSFYGYGHTHTGHYISSYYLNSETLVYNVKSLGKDNKYAIIAVDSNGISATEADAKKWPVVLITNPLDKNLGESNPFAQPISSGEVIPIRALIFSDADVPPEEVEFQYKKKNSIFGWKNIPADKINKAYSLNNAYSYLWEGEWDTCGFDSGEYQIRVMIGNEADQSDQIMVDVEEPAYGVDTILVIDTSGSMWGEKIEAAKSSAKMFVSFMQPDDGIGVVRFDYSAYQSYRLIKIESDNPDAVKDAAKNAINNLSANGGTCIGAGLQEGQRQLDTYGRCDPVWSMVLLSDGQDGCLSTTNGVLLEIMKKKTRIYVIGLGVDADELLLNQIAQNTGGFYRYAPSGEWLAAIYQDIQNAAGGLQGIVSYASNIIQGEIKKFDIVVDSALKAVFQASIKGSDIDLTLIDPDGNEITPETAASDPDVTYISAGTLKSYTVLTPGQGNWQMVIAGTDVEAGGEPINVGASISAEITLSVDFDRIDYASGDPITVIAKLEDTLGPIPGADISADVQTPSGTDNLTLYDDGLHNDDASNDGTYAAVFLDTATKGNYTFQVNAKGVSNESQSFTRTATKTTVVGQDTDGDGMTDIWEDLYGLDKNVDDATGDADVDGLTNIQEYGYRTNPTDVDTDGDGYDDKEEIDLGSDPSNSDNIPIYIHALCQDITVYLNGSVTIAADQIDNGSTAFYGIASLAVAPDTFDNLGEYEVLLTVTGTQGHIGQCVAIVTVAVPPVVPDTTSPVALCRNITVGIGSITASSVNNGSTDDVGVASLAVAPDTFTCEDIGSNDVTLTVTDTSGNWSQCNANITVEDRDDPVAVCRDEIEIWLDESGSASISVDEVDNGSHDNCGEVSLSLSKTGFTCSDVGNESVTLTVTDESGNTSQCDTSVAIGDDLPPVPDISLLPDVSGDETLEIATPTATDNCSGIIDGTADVSFLDTSGESIVVWTYADEHGNIVTQEQRVMIEISVEPDATEDVSDDIDDIIATKKDDDDDNCFVKMLERWGM